MLKRSVAVAIVLVIGSVFGVVTLAFTQAKPATRTGLHQIHAAAKALEQAQRHLERAQHPFGGHRARAVELVRLAEDELKQAVEFAKANPPAGGKAPKGTPSTTPAPAAPATKQ